MRNPARHPYYASWRMKIRKCEDPNNPQYHRYGGRGIAMHDRWRSFPSGFLAFIRYIDRYLGPRPKNHDLDRIDNDRGYVPGNLQWLAHSRHSQKTRADHPHGNPSRLSEVDVREIRRLCTDAPWGTQSRVARQFGVDTSHVSRIVRKESWR